MAGVAAKTTGMICLFAAGVMYTFNLAVSRVVRAWGWPFFRVMGTLSLIIASAIACLLLLPCSGPSFACKREEIKWVVLRGFCGAAAFLLNVCAIALGVPVGDVGAMSSINMIAAALFGTLFLGERLGLAHMGAVCLSVLGAVLISSPSELASNIEGQGASVVFGYVLALLGGTVQGYLFICARKSKTASVWLMTFSTMSQRGLLCWLMAVTGMVDDGAVGALAETPNRTGLVASVMLVTAGSSNLMTSAGAKLCPAAISATVATAVNMSVGYLAQVVIFDEKPAVLTLLGALMMFMAVVIMSLARLPPKPASADGNAAPPAAVAEASGAPENLAEFIASEYAQEPAPSPSDGTPLPAPAVSVRLRHIAPATVGHALTPAHG